MRVSNDEREEVVAELIAHWSDGRLDEPTFDQRASRARAAVTRADLDRLLGDLPSRQPVAVRATPRHRRPGWAATVIVVLLVLAASSEIPALVHPRIPWALIGVVAVVASGRHRHRHR